MKILLSILICALVGCSPKRTAEEKATPERAVEENAVKLSDVPQDVQDKVKEVQDKSKSNGGAMTFYKRSEGWRVDCERNGKPISLLILTEENVVDGKTNVIVTRIDPVSRKSK
jgi:hypothetical protein